MAQTWTDDTFAAGHVAQTDLQNMENNFACLKSCFSGAAAPAGAVAGQLWFETDQKVLKTRNAANNAWYGLFHGDTSEKRLVYRDAAMDGYARDAGVTDKVIALKGGATYVAGGATAGTAGISDHTLTDADVPVHFHYGSIAVKDGASAMLRAAVGNAGVRQCLATAPASWDAAYGRTDTKGSGGAHSHGGATYRPAGAVCILIYLDL